MPLRALGPARRRKEGKSRGQVCQELPEARRQRDRGTDRAEHPSSPYKPQAPPPLSPIFPLLASPLRFLFRFEALWQSRYASFASPRAPCLSGSVQCRAAGVYTSCKVCWLHFVRVYCDWQCFPRRVDEVSDTSLALPGQLLRFPLHSSPHSIAQRSSALQSEQSGVSAMQPESASTWLVCGCGAADISVLPMFPPFRTASFRTWSIRTVSIRTVSVRTAASIAAAITIRSPSRRHVLRFQHIPALLEPSAGQRNAGRRRRVCGWPGIRPRA